MHMIDAPITLGCYNTLVLTLLRGLSDKFCPMVTNIKLRQPFPTFAEARTLLLLEEIDLNDFAATPAPRPALRRHLRPPPSSLPRHRPPLAVPLVAALLLVVPLEALLCTPLAKAVAWQDTRAAVVIVVAVASTSSSSRRSRAPPSSRRVRRRCCTTPGRTWCRSGSNQQHRGLPTALLHQPTRLSSSHSRATRCPMVLAYPSDTATGRQATTSPLHRSSSRHGTPCMEGALTRPPSPATSAP